LGFPDVHKHFDLFIELATPQPHLNKCAFWLKDLVDMIHTFNLVKRSLKNIKPFYSSKKNTCYYLESGF